jgi:Ion channel
MIDDQPSFLIRQLKTISGYLKCISPMRWLKNIYPDFENPSPSLTEKYVLICLLIEILIALAFLAPSTGHSSIAAWVVGILAVIRIVEIVGRIVDVTEVISPPRTLILAGINYFELALCFGVLYASNYQSLNGASRPITAFYFSIITQLTIGYGDVSPRGWLRLVVVVQGMLSALFIITVFARAIAALPIHKGKDRP